MNRLSLFVSLIACVFCTCSNQTPKDNYNIGFTTQEHKVNEHFELIGTWVRYNRSGFTLIEIKDTSNVLYYQFIDRQIETDKPSNDRFWYYKSKATMGYWNNSAIWIATDKFRFDYKLKGRILVEFDKMGDQGTFVEVRTDE